MMNMQSVFRRKRTRDFTVLGNETLEDSRLTFEARGLLCFLLAKPLDWTVIMSHIINSSPAGKHKVHRMVDELLKYGYLVRSRKRDPEGRFICTLYEVYDEPQSNYRKVDKRSLQKKQLSKNTDNKETTTVNKLLMDNINWPKKICHK